MRSPVAKLLLMGVLVAGAIALPVVRYRPPPAVPASAPPTAFSAERAWRELERVVGDGAPRPIGSAASQASRERIMGRLTELGYTVSVQDTFACGSFRSCARVRNIVAQWPGRETGKWVLLSAHYDSVGAGPGASDDGMAVAAQLEIARALAASPQTRNGVLLLVNEGEESGLIGAEAFVAEHPFAQRVGAVVNVEARGTNGPSFMFETSQPNGWLIQLYAASVRRPATNSIAYSIYRMLPNETDLTVYKRAGLSGLNFGIIGGEQRYHTPRDDLAHADPSSLQHQGENALAMVRELADVDLEGRTHEEEAFFDVFSLYTVRWPLRWMRPLAGAAALLVALGTVLAVWRRRARAREVAWGILAWVDGVALAAALAAAAYAALHLLGVFPYAWIASPGAARVALWAAGVLGVALPLNVLAPRANDAGLWLGAAIGWAFAGVVSALTAPGLSYVLVLPALAAAAQTAVWSLGRKPKPREVVPVGAWVWILPYAVGAIVWMPLVWLLYDALGAKGLAASGAAFGLLLSLMAPEFRVLRVRGLIAAGAVVVGVAVGLASGRQTFTRDAPNKLRLEYVLDASGSSPRARWAALTLGEGIPPALQAAGPFTENPVEPFPWPNWRRSYVAEAPRLDLPAPVLEVVEASGGRIRARLSSPRGALDAGLVVPSNRLRAARVNGKTVPPASTRNQFVAIRSGLMSHVLCHTTGSEGVEVELEIDGDAPVKAYVWDATPGLPEAGAALAAARSEQHVPFQEGDRTFVYTRQDLVPGRTQ